MVFTIKQFAGKAKQHKVAAFYTGVHSVAQIITMICQFVALKFIDPIYIGAWQAALVIQVYLAFTQMGVISALNREYPHANARGEDAVAADMMCTAHAYNILNALLIATVFGGLLVWHWNSDVMWRWAYGMMALVAFFDMLRTYLQSMYRCTGRFATLSWIGLAQIPLAVLIPVGAAYFDFPGYLIGFLIISLSTCIVLFFFRPLKLMPAFKRSAFRVLFSTGWRLYLRHYLMRIGRAMPRMALGLLHGIELLGMFAPVNAVNGLIMNVAQSLQGFLLPRLAAKHAHGAENIAHLTLKVTGLVMLATLPVVVLGELVLPSIIEGLLPKYASSVPAIRVVLIAGFFESANLATVAFTAAKAWRLMYIHVVIKFVLQSGCIFLGIVLGRILWEDPLLGLAYGMLTASILILGPIWFLVSRVVRVD